MKTIDDFKDGYLVRVDERGQNFFLHFDTCTYNSSFSHQNKYGIGYVFDAGMASETFIPTTNVTRISKITAEEKYAQFRRDEEELKRYIFEQSQSAQKKRKKNLWKVVW